MVKKPGLYIERRAAQEALLRLSATHIQDLDTVSVMRCFEEISNLPEADVVSRDCFNGVLCENDDARAQLASVGKHIGDDMSDVGKVYRATYRWIRPSRGEPKIHCNNCKNEYDADMWMGKLLYSFCPYCGAKMDGCDEAPTNPIKSASDGVMPCW